MKSSVQEGLEFIKKQEKLKTKNQAEKFVQKKYPGFLFESVISYLFNFHKK